MTVSQKNVRMCNAKNTNSHEEMAIQRNESYKKNDYAGFLHNVLDAYRDFSVQKRCTAKWEHVLAAVLHTEMAAHANCGAMCKLNTRHIINNNEV